MSATEKLRALLDERGVEYARNGCEVFFVVNDKPTHIWAIDDEELCVSIAGLAPEQAIAATLDGGECEWELEHSGTLYDKWRCSECKFLFVEPRCDQGYMDLVPNYCPNFGRRVKGGKNDVR